MKKIPSLFFPLALIATGGVWLMVQTKMIPAENLWALAHIWPFALIALGLGLILRSVWHEGAGIVVSALIVGGAVLAIVFAPQLGWTSAPQNWDINGNFTGALKGSGKLQTVTRELKSFDAISIEYPAEILIMQGDYETIKIQADDNLLPQLSSEIQGGKLIVKNSETQYSKRVNPSDTVKIAITVKELRRVDFYTAGSLAVKDLQGEALRVEINGAGGIELSGVQLASLDCVLNGAGDIAADGSAEKVNVEINGFGSFNGKNFQSDSADVSINGAGDVNLRVKSNLAAEINGAGSIGYYGSPNVNQRVNGAGSVNQLEK